MATRNMEEQRRDGYIVGYKRNMAGYRELVKI